MTGEELKANVTEVDGVAVVAVHPAHTGLSGKPTVGGQEILFKRAIALEMADGSVLYGCVWPGCEFTHRNGLTVASAHWRSHEPVADLSRTPFKDWTLEQILGRLMDAEADLNKVMAQRDKAITQVSELKTKIKAMEEELRDLDKMRKLLAPKSAA